jgi:hypothetical protein
LKTFIQTLFACGLVSNSFSLVQAAPNWQDTTAVPTKPVYADSPLVSIDAGEWRWSKFRYEAELRIAAPVYLERGSANAPANIYIWVNVETPGASLWQDDNRRIDYLALSKDQPQVTVKVRWLTGGPITLAVRTGGIKTTVQTRAAFPVLLLLVSSFGGAVGGWLRRARDPASVVDLRVRLLPEKWSRRLAPVREVIVSMIAGVLLYLLNEVSPIYLGFRSGFGEEWLALVPPLLIGFIGGWGGINLLVGLLEQLFGKGREAVKTKAAVEQEPPAAKK